MIQLQQELFLQQHQRCVSQKTGALLGYFLRATAHTTLPVFCLYFACSAQTPTFDISRVPQGNSGNTESLVNIEIMILMTWEVECSTGIV